jgi:hypothetical protein
MNRIVTRSKVGNDGILHLSLPDGLAEADHEVQITVESLGEKTPVPQAKCCDWVDSMAGSWEGEFQRPPQGEYEEREPLS